MAEPLAEDDDMADDAKSAEYGLVMPYVVCASQGGPMDDHAFVAGCRFTGHAAELKAAPHIIEWADYVYPDMVPQYDLLAMHYGFVMTSEPWDEFPNEWVLVMMSRPPATPEEAE